MKYTLVNPFVTGSINTSIESNNPNEAAKALYTRVSKHFTNNLPRFFFSIIDEKNNLKHYEVNEKKLGKEVNFAIKSAKMKESGERKVLAVYEKLSNQEGGKKKKVVKDDSSSDSSNESSSDSSSSSDNNDFSSSDDESPYVIPAYEHPLRKLLYTPEYIIDVYDTVLLDYPSEIYIPMGAPYTSIITDESWIIR
jgi:hypothetical protein